MQAAHAHVNRYLRFSQACLSAVGQSMGVGPYVIVTYFKSASDLVPI